MNLLWGVPNRIGNVDVVVTRITAEGLELVWGSTPKDLKWRAYGVGGVVSTGGESWRVVRILPTLDTMVTVPGTTLEAPIAAELERVETK